MPDPYFNTDSEKYDEDYKYKYLLSEYPDFCDSFMKLNKYQKSAVLNEDRVMLLNAGVGSGKTTVLVHKIMYLYLIKKVPLSDMVVLTFTNKAAGEIKERILKWSDNGIDTRGLKYFGTFHSVARNLLSSVLPVGELGYTKDFSVLDENGLSEMYESIIQDRGLNIKYKNRIDKTSCASCNVYLCLLP